MKAVLRMVMRGGVRVGEAMWTSPALASHEGVVVAVAVLAGVACPLTRLEG